MHSPAAVAEVLALRREGLGGRRIALVTGLPLATVRDWLAGRVPRHSAEHGAGGAVAATCGQCGHAGHQFDALPSQYVYLLGLYLGDGTISRHARGVFRLRIFLDLRYPQIVEDCAAAMTAVMPSSKVGCLLRHGNYTNSVEASHVEVSSFSKAWECLFPQHGPRRKHEREIALSEWQLKLVRRAPDQLIRGLSTPTAAGS